MANSKKSGKLVIFALVALVGAAAGAGYFTQVSKLDDKPKEAKEEPAAGEKTADAKPAASAEEMSKLLAITANDVVIGDANAPVTIVEYSSLSCPHCAHFHSSVLPELQKQMIDTGKAKLVVRAFPLNEPAIKGSVVIECAGKNGLKRENFIKVLFEMQAQWAVSADPVKDLKQIALVGGLDSATFDSCMNDKELETSALTSRQQAETTLAVSSTPTFFVNGKKLEGAQTVESFKNAIEGAAIPTK